MNPKRGGFDFVMLVLILVGVSSAWAASREKVLRAFNGKDGWAPSSVSLDSHGALYGTTWWGGTNACLNSGCGVVFQLKRSTNGKWHETMLHEFDNADGFFPNGNLLLDSAGNLYGTTVYGGNSGCTGLGCGVVFELRRGARGMWTEKVLHVFDFTDGSWPYAGLISDSQGSLYGTTSTGGNSSACTGGCGVVFELRKGANGQWSETVLYSFQGTDGETPLAPLTFDAAGNLYGTTQYGGAHGTGTVFRLTRSAGGQWTEQVLYSFGGYDTKDGYEPVYGVIFDSTGNLYGTTQFGGTYGEQGWGTAFRLTPVGGGKWSETVLHTFDEHRVGGGFVSTGLVLDTAGNLYGAASLGGKYTCPYGGGVGCGVVFKLTSHANGNWSETVLHSFGKGNDGAGPSGGLVLDPAGHLFGVTDSGGYVGGPCGKGGFTGCGVIFEIRP